MVLLDVFRQQHIPNPCCRPQAPRHKVFFSRDDDVRYQCSVCLYSSARALAGACQTRQAPSHLLWSAGDLVRCILCGAHSRISVRTLRRSCPRKVVTAAMGRALEGFRYGFHPVIQVFVGAPAPFQLRPLTLHGLVDESDSK